MVLFFLVCEFVLVLARESIFRLNYFSGFFYLLLFFLLLYYIVPLEELVYFLYMFFLKVD
jgi:hypothetical protein